MGTLHRMQCAHSEQENCIYYEFGSGEYSIQLGPDKELDLKKYAGNDEVFAIERIQ